MKFKSQANIREDVETFLCWYAGVYIISAIIAGFAIPYAIQQIVICKGSDISTNLAYLSAFIPHMTGVVAAVWFWRRKYPSNRSRAIWTLFGLAAPLWSVGIYLLVVAITPIEQIDSVTKADT